MNSFWNKLLNIKLSLLCLVLYSAIGILKSEAQVCGSGNNLFGITSSGSIYPINSTTGSVGGLINTTAYASPAPSQSNALGYNPINGLFYYFKINPAPLTTQQFVSYNPVSKSYSILAASPTSASVHAGCVSFDGSGYYCLDVNGVLYYYNIAANKWVTINSNLVDQYSASVTSVIKSQTSGDMAIDGLGNLWILPSSSSNYSLYKINAPLPKIATASIKATRMIAPTTATPASSSFQGMAFDAFGSLYMITGSAILYKLTNTSTLTKIATLTNTNVTADLTSCSFPFGILPLTWSSFSVGLNENSKQVSLNWDIDNAKNIKGFYVEKSNNNSSWTVIDYITYDITQTSYATIDANPLPGNNYYRIRAENFDMEEDYSAIKTVNIESTIKISVWPNPVKSSVTIQNNSSDYNTHAQLFDMFGKEIKVVLLQQGNNSIDMSNLQTGAYILHIQTSGGAVYNEKIFKQ